MQDALPSDEVGAQFGMKGSPVVDWIRGLGLAKYEEVFVREEVDWDTLQWLTEEVSLCLFSISAHTIITFRFIYFATQT